MQSLKILLTGGTGYIAKRLLPVLLEDGHRVVCCVRDKRRFDTSPYPASQIEVVEVDFLKAETLQGIPDDIDAAYYLIHSMSADAADFSELEREAAENFKARVEGTRASQVIYLSGIVNDPSLSRHLRSRKCVEDTLASPHYALTTLRAGIIIGSGSASFEIMRDLVEKLPVMIAPKWVHTKCQPIAVRNVIDYLRGALGNREAFGRSFDIGGEEILSYKEMLLRFARIRNLRRHILIVPVLTPRLSSYWLCFVTSTSFRLAANLVNSMRVEVVCDPARRAPFASIPTLSYEDAIRLAFDKVEQQDVLSSWTDALSRKGLEKGVGALIEVPTFGCFHDCREKPVRNHAATLERIWAIGGRTGWYYANPLWRLRGFIDKMIGGVGLRRGRKTGGHIAVGDSLDFWRVLYADRATGRLLLYAEMKLPGEAWLEFRLENNRLRQTATFRPLGLWGRCYWYALLPVHLIIFDGMARRLAE